MFSALTVSIFLQKDAITQWIPRSFITRILHQLMPPPPKEGSPRDWSVGDVGKWLKEVGYSKYATLFADQVLLYFLTLSSF